MIDPSDLPFDPPFDPPFGPRPPTASLPTFDVDPGDGPPDTDDPGSHDLGDPVLTPTGGVPEPATWAMMILGLGGVGATLRRRRRMTA